MKVVKLLTGIIVAGLLLVALVLALAFVPALQTWAARKAVAGLPGTDISIGRVSAGLSSATIDGLRVVQNGRIVTADKITARYSAFDYLLHHRITVDALAVSRVVVDLRHATPATQSNSAAPSSSLPSGTAATPPTPKPLGNATAASRIPFDGVLHQIVIPYNLRVASISVQGRALLPRDQTATFDVQVHNLNSGGEGTVTWNATLSSSQADSAYRTARSSATVKIRLSQDGHVDAVDLNALASAEGPALPTDQFKLTASASRQAGSGDERYALQLTDLHDGAADTLFEANGQYQVSTKSIDGTWKSSLRGERLAAFSRSLNLPEVSVAGAGTFAFDPDSGAASTKGDLQAGLAHLERLSPALAGIGGLSLHVGFDAGFANQFAKLSRLSVIADDAHGNEVARITAAQPIAFSLASKTVSLAEPSRELAKIAVTNLPLAWVQPLTRALTIDSGRLSLGFAVTATPDGRQVRLTPSTSLTVRELSLHSGGKPVVVGLNLSVRPSAEYDSDSVRATLADLSVSTPAGDQLGGQAQVDVTRLSSQPSIAFSYTLHSRIVAALKPFLHIQTGVLELSSASAGSLTGPSLRVTHSTTELFAGSQKLVSFSLLQPITVHLGTMAVASDEPTRSAIRLQIARVPLSLANAYVPGASFAGEIHDASFEINLRSLDDLSIATPTPLSLQGIGITMNGKALLRDVDLTADFSATARAKAIDYDVKRLTVTGGGRPLAQLTVAGSAPLGGKPNLSAKGTLHADLAALMQQPLAPAGAGLASGNLDATFDATVADMIRATAKLTIRNLVSATNRQALGDLDLGLDASLGAQGADRLHIPFTLTKAGRTSDLLVDGSLSQSASGISFDGQVTSKQLFTDDLQALAALVPQGAPTPAAQENATVNVSETGSLTPTRDTHPFWHGFGGKLQVRFGTITYGTNYVISGIHGSAEVTPARLALDSLEGSLNNNPFKVAATVAFDATKPQPYGLTASTKVSDFDVGAFLKASNPDEPPQLETKVTVDATLDGQGSTVADLAQHVRGKFDLTGSKGVLRALGKKGGTAVNIVSNLVGLFGAARGSEGTVAVADLAKKLSAMPFDALVVHAERNADLDLKVTKIEFSSPDTRLTGSGQIIYQKGTPIQNQSMQFTLQLAGKGQMAYLMNRAKLLSGQTDDQGYSTMSTTFTLSGTPVKPNSDDLWRIIGQAALGAGLGNQLGKLFGQ